jgi:hypothetical protein
VRHGRDPGHVLFGLPVALHLKESVREGTQATCTGSVVMTCA